MGILPNKNGHIINTSKIDFYILMILKKFFFFFMIIIFNFLEINLRKNNDLL
jgi:hypothetical protein